jgi:hypothetical protein
MSIEMKERSIGGTAGGNRIEPECGRESGKSERRKTPESVQKRVKEFAGPRRCGKYQVEGITFTNSAKEQLTFENRAIEIPDDEHIRADLRAVKQKNTFAGNLRFVAERTDQGHGDRFLALAPVIHAAQSTSSQREVFFEHISQNWRIGP